MKRDEVSVSFDSAPGLTAAQHRRTHNPPSQAPPSSQLPPFMPSSSSGSHATAQLPVFRPDAVPGATPSPAGGMPFMSFDLGSQGGAFAPPPSAPVGVPGGPFGGNSFDDEPPLLEELGINIPLILQKTSSILLPLRGVKPELHDDGDLSGPLLFCLLFGFLQLLARKNHFGVILGWSSFSSLLLFSLFSLLVSSHSHSSLDLYSCCSLFGYGLIPLLPLSALSIFLGHGNLLLLLLSLGSIFWCSSVCSSLLLAFVPNAQDYRLLLAYPCALLYSAFALLIVF